MQHSGNWTNRTTNDYASTTHSTTSSNASDFTRPIVCLGVIHIFIAVVLVLLIFGTVVGNTLVILSVCIYKRLQTFTNYLLISLAMSDLFVGVLIMPISMINLLQGYWQFGKTICQIWATTDVLLCTASILNLCTISLDRYFAISWPLKYYRRRNKRFAMALIAMVWVVSVIICAPPWFVKTWGFSVSVDIHDDLSHNCNYVLILSYRIYSAAGSFFIPLLVMLFVYYRIYKVSAAREATLSLNRQGSRLLKMHRGRGQMAGTFAVTALALGGIGSGPLPRLAPPPSNRPRSTSPGDLLRDEDSNSDTADVEEYTTRGPETTTAVMYLGLRHHTVDNRHKRSISVSPRHTPDLAAEKDRSESGERCTKSEHHHHQHHHHHHKGGNNHVARKQPNRLIETAKEYFLNNRDVRPCTERKIYLKEKKALKTIGIVVSAFVFCWLPFFACYIIEAACAGCLLPKHLSTVILWLGYSNSVLNPVIYAMYHQDFRRGFRDLLVCGCLRKDHLRRQSVRMLHQLRM